MTKTIFSWTKQQTFVRRVFSVLTIASLILPYLIFPITIVAEINSVIFDESGIFIVPEGVTEITVEAWGAGGSGGQNNGTGHRGGGGGGAYARSVITVEPASEYEVVVGKGGIPSPGASAPGGDSYFADGSQVLARGGKGATGANNGGAGGGIQNSVGQVKFFGGSGGNRASGNNTAGGGGGGSATAEGNGEDGLNGSGSIGGAGGAGQGAGGAGGDNGQNGRNGIAPGGGGGGRGANGETSGVGADGRVIISWTIPIIPHDPVGEGSIGGLKFNDANGNGVKDETEMGLASWTITLFDAEGEALSSILTDESGNYIFEELLAGDYRVCESFPEVGFWSQTYPTDDLDDTAACDNGTTGWTVTISDDGMATGKDFGNREIEPSSIAGIKWHDINGNGVRDNNESTLVGWVIYLDLNDNGLLDEGEPETVTGEDGSYLFANLLPSNYIVREVAQAGWVQTYPVTGFQATTTIAGEDITGLDFGNTEGISVTGYKWHDLNFDGFWNLFEELDGVNEPVLAGWTIKAFELDEEGELVNGGKVKEAITDGYGQYQFGFISGDFGYWRIMEENQAGWTQTTDSFFDVFVDVETSLNGELDGEIGDTYLNFGNWQNPVIQVFKWEDQDADGERDLAEEENFIDGPISDWPMALGKVGQVGEDEIIPIEIVALSLTGDHGRAELFAPEPGQYVVLEGIKNGWVMTSPATREKILSFTFADGIESFAVDQNSFFDVFVTAEDFGKIIGAGEFVGEEINEIVPLAFGNYKLLIISGETAAEVTENFAVITWTTDRPGTSRVVWGQVSNPELGEEPNYGYPNSTETFDADPKVTEHSVPITGLTAGTTYFYRVISAGSPELVGEENSFTTVASPAEENNNNGGGSGGRSSSGGFGGSGGGSGGFVQNLSSQSDSSDVNLRPILPSLAFLPVVAVPGQPILVDFGEGETVSEENLTDDSFSSEFPEEIFAEINEGQSNLDQVAATFLGLPETAAKFILWLILALIILYVIYRIWQGWRKKRNNRQLND